ncbi:hypothetical protein NOVO_08830 [Rickettsiales bacterium Ac37b]|nr:hypothetical protein NOVO_08830 [Rickettsiales bacterium Ac37b]
MLKKNKGDPTFDLSAAIRKVVFNLAENNSIEEIKYIITHSSEYPFLINTAQNGHTIEDFYTNYPEMLKLFFEHDLIPNVKYDTHKIQNILRSEHSVHDSNIVKKGNFITQELKNFTNLSKEELEVKAEYYKNNLSNLFKEGNINLLDLTEQDIKSALKNIEPTLTPSPHEFVQIIKNKVTMVLNNNYLHKDCHNNYDTIYATKPLQYNWSEGNEAYITIPESIGLIVSLIDKINIPRREKQELCVTLLRNNAEFVENNLTLIKSLLKKDNISAENLKISTRLHDLLSELTEEEIATLFYQITQKDIEDIWREQQEFKLAKQIFIASTAYGEDNSACIPGVWIQIINSAEEIDPKLLDKFAEYIAEMHAKEAQKEAINEINVIPIVEEMIDIFYTDKALMKMEKKEKEGLMDILINMLNISEPTKLTSSEQVVLSIINQFIIILIEKHLPNYKGEIPTLEEYKIIINKIPEAKKTLPLYNKLNIENQITSNQSMNENQPPQNISSNKRQIDNTSDSSSHINKLKKLNNIENPISTSSNNIPDKLNFTEMATRSRSPSPEAGPSWSR